MYQELLQLGNNKANNRIQKWAKDLNRPFSEEDKPKADKGTEKISTSLSVREMAIKTTMGYPSPPFSMATVQNDRK